MSFVAYNPSPHNTLSVDAETLLGLRRIAGDSQRRARRHTVKFLYIARIASRTFFGASSNWSVSIEYEARPFVRERIAVE